MRTKYNLIVLSIVGALAAVVAVVYAGNPNSPPGPPETTSSYTLEHIYDRVDTGTAAESITFTEPISGPVVGTMHTLDEIYDLLGERAFVPKTGQTMSYTVGGDGDLQMGIQWPIPRFTDNGDGSVTDNLTGLVWLKNANCFGSRVWANALSDANELAAGYCGLTDGSNAGDWRLPNIRELQSLIDYSQYSIALPSDHPFTDTEAHYWSSTTFAEEPSFAWWVNLGLGSVDYADKTSTFRCVLPVRDGQ